MIGGIAFPLRTARAIGLALLGLCAAGPAVAGVVQVFHADSLAGPMRELKQAFESRHPGVTIDATSGTSQELAERILKGDACDVFMPSSPAVIDRELMKDKAASWYVVFSGNEMVVITRKGNPLDIREASDLAKPGLKFLRVTSEKDLATGRTVEFLKRATAREGRPALAQAIVDAAIVDPSKPSSIPETVRAVRAGEADAGIVYYSAAVAARNDVAIVRFPADVNLSEAIRNAATVPRTTKNPKEATAFVRFLLTAEARTILQDTGQPPVVPAIQKGDVPAAVIR